VTEDYQHDEAASPGWADRLLGTFGLGERGSGETVAHCPVDDWDFRPLYTDGVCPLCGWAPEGAVRSFQRQTIDWFWPAVGAMAVASGLMAILVILAYVRA
jgi:hypothetical protein